MISLCVLKCYSYSIFAKNTIISPTFLVWKFPQFPHSFEGITRMQKMCPSTKFPHQVVRCNYDIFRILDQSEMWLSKVLNRTTFFGELIQIDMARFFNMYVEIICIALEPFSEEHYCHQYLLLSHRYLFLSFIIQWLIDTYMEKKKKKLGRNIILSHMYRNKRIRIYFSIIKKQKKLSRKPK